MTRALLACMAGLLCAFAGIKHAASLKGDAARLARWVQLLRHLTLLLEEGTLSIPEALNTTAEGRDTPDHMLRNIGQLLADSPIMTASDAFLKCCDALPEKTALIRMFTRLGRGSKQNRILAVQQAAEELQLMANAASARAEKDARLWQTLGFIGGACVTIILL